MQDKCCNLWFQPKPTEETDAMKLVCLLFMSIISSLLRNSETDTDIISTYWLGIRGNWKNIRVKRFHARNVGISLSHSIYMIKMRHVFSIGLMILFRLGWLGGSVNQTDHVKPFFHIFLTCVRGWTSTINLNTTWQTYESMVLPFQTFTCVCECVLLSFRLLFDESIWQFCVCLTGTLLKFVLYLSYHQH